MTRIKISVCIVALLIGMSIFSGVWVDKKCSSLTELSVSAENLFSQGEKEKAIIQTKKLENEWEDFRKKASVLLRNDKLAEIDRICARVRHLAENDSEELLSELTELKHLLELLKDGEIPKITSVF